MLELGDDGGIYLALYAYDKEGNIVVLAERDHWQVWNCRFCKSTYDTPYNTMKHIKDKHIHDSSTD